MAVLRWIRSIMAAVQPGMWGDFGTFRTYRSELAMGRYKAINNALMFTRHEDVSGDYLEFGVARGRTLIYAMTCDRRLRRPNASKTRFFVFDSFSGFPEPKGIDAIHQRFKKGQERHPRKTLERNIRKYGFKDEDITIVEGYYDATLKPGLAEDLKIEQARVVNIDCDLYESALSALNFITPLVTDGTVLLFDDWFCYRAREDRGEQRAFAEWLAGSPHIKSVPYQQYANVGKSFILYIADS